MRIFFEEIIKFSRYGGIVVSVFSESQNLLQVQISLRYVSEPPKMWCFLKTPLSRRQRFPIQFLPCQPQFLEFHGHHDQRLQELL